MFEELYRKSGALLIRDGYTDGEPKYKSIEVVYFALEGQFRDDTGGLQSETVFCCKSPDLVTALDVPIGTRFQDENGKSYDLSVITIKYHHFDDKFELLRCVVAK